MNIINEIFENIKFNINPDENYRKKYLFRFLKRIYSLSGKEKLFLFNNLKILNGKEDIYLKKILLNIESMSTYAIGHIINQICKNLKKDELYVNIGVWKGFTLIAGMINTNCNVQGVDNFSEFGGPKDIFLDNFNKFKITDKHKFYEFDYKVFFMNFEKTNSKINFYFYDGEHSYKNQYDNLEIANNFFVKDSIVLVDDINFEEVEQGTEDFIRKNSSKFRLIKKIKTKNNHCHPTYWNGIMIFQKK